MFSALLSFFHVTKALIGPGGQGLFIIEASRSHSDTPHSVGLLWTSDELDAENSDNIQYPQETDIRASGGTRTCNRSKRVAADPRLRPSGHWNRLSCILI